MAECVSMGSGMEMANEDDFGDNCRLLFVSDEATTAVVHAWHY